MASMIFTWIYLGAGVIVLVAEAVALVWQNKGGPASLTVSEKVVPLRSKVVTIWMALPWLSTHLLFAPTEVWFMHHATLGILGSLAALVVSALWSFFVVEAAKGWAVRVIVMIVGASLGYLTPIP